MKKTINYSTTLLMTTFLSLFLLSSCTKPKFDSPVKFAGDKWVSAKTLNLGYETYMGYCMQCHGIEGDGKGPAAYGAYPPPRNFKEGLFKFAQVETGSLPRDIDLKHTIRYGLKGTPMLPWDMSDKRLNAVVQYIKTFSEVWQEEEAGEVLSESKDPFGPEKYDMAVDLGKKAYHGVGKCWTCHPSYVPKNEINLYSKELTGDGANEFRKNMHIGVTAASSYGVNFTPPDYTNNWIKTGGDVVSNYRLLNSGVNGTAMAAWKGMLSSTGDEKESEKYQWAIAYYLNYLSKLKFNHNKRKAFFAKLKSQIQKDSTPKEQ